MSSFVAYLHFAALLCYLSGSIKSRGVSLDRKGRWLGYAGILFQAVAVYQLAPHFGFRTFNIGVAIAHFSLFSMIAITSLDRQGGFPKSWSWLCLLGVLGSALCLLPLPTRDLPQMSGSLVLHLALATLAYSAYIVSISQMTETFLVGRSIARHEKKEGALALLSMEGIVFRNVLVGFALLTLTIVTGVTINLSGSTEAETGYLTHKNLFAVLTWVLSAVLILGRWKKGWRGVVALRWYAASTGCLVLSYIGTIIVLDLILNR